MPAALAGLDYGTGGAKAAIISTDGRVLAYAFEEYPILTPRPGWSEHDPARYWDCAGRLLRRVIAASGVAPLCGAAQIHCGAACADPLTAAAAKATR